MAADGRSDLYGQIRIYSDTGLLVASLNADHLAEGLYSVDWTPALEGRYTMVGELYFDALRTATAGYEKVAEDIDVNTTKTSIMRLLGLGQENQVVDQQAYDVDGNILSARIRLYDTKTNALLGGAGGVVATYTATMSYDVNGRLLNFTRVRDS
jgi:hypothetical protein